MKELVLRCVIEREGRYYNALCLDLDIASFGGSIEEAKENLQETIELYLDYAFEENLVEEMVPRKVPDFIEAHYKRKSERKQYMKH